MIPTTMTITTLSFSTFTARLYHHHQQQHFHFFASSASLLLWFFFLLLLSSRSHWWWWSPEYNISSTWSRSGANHYSVIILIEFDHNSVSVCECVQLQLQLQPGHHFLALSFSSSARQSSLNLILSLHFQQQQQQLTEMNEWMNEWIRWMETYSTCSNGSVCANTLHYFTRATYLNVHRCTSSFLLTFCLSESVGGLMKSVSKGKVVVVVVVVEMWSVPPMLLLLPSSFLLISSLLLTDCINDTVSVFLLPPLIWLTDSVVEKLFLLLLSNLFKGIPLCTLTLSFSLSLFSL